MTYQQQIDQILQNELTRVLGKSTLEQPAVIKDKTLEYELYSHTYDIYRQ